MVAKIWPSSLWEISLTVTRIEKYKKPKLKNGQKQEALLVTLKQVQKRAMAIFNCLTRLLKSFIEFINHIIKINVKYS